LVHILNEDSVEAYITFSSWIRYNFKASNRCHVYKRWLTNNISELPGGKFTPYVQIKIHTPVSSTSLVIDIIATGEEIICDMVTFLLYNSKR